MDLERFDKILRIRTVLSAVVYTIFLGVGLHGVLTGWHFDNPTPAVALLLVGFFAWPRRANPKDWEPEEPESTAGRQQLRARGILQRRLNRVRMYYFFAAAFVLALLPHLLGESVFEVFGGAGLFG